MNNYPPGVTGNEPEIAEHGNYHGDVPCIFCCESYAYYDGTVFTVERDEGLITFNSFHCPRCECDFYVGSL